MSVKPATVDKYVKAAVKARDVVRLNPEVEAREFCRENSISTNFFGELTRTGYLVRENGRYQWTGKPITVKDMRRLLETRNATNRLNGSLDEPEHRRAPSNDPIYPDIDHTTRLERQVEELTQRVAAMEQLMIRRGVA